MEFNSAQRDSMIDRLRQSEKIWFKTPPFFHWVDCVCNFFIIISFSVLWALQLIAYSKPKRWTPASHSCLTRCEREREMKDRERPPPVGNEDWNKEREKESDGEKKEEAGTWQREEWRWIRNGKDGSDFSIVRRTRTMHKRCINATMHKL